MLRNILRRAILLLSGLLLTAIALPDAAQARGGFYARGYGLYRAFAAVGLGVGLGYGYYGYPLDDSYDYPYGYGEYAEYGPWAYGGYVSGGCFLTQKRVRNANGARWRTVRVCN